MNLIILIGLIAKNGMLIVGFANQRQVREGLGEREALARRADRR